MLNFDLHANFTFSYVILILKLWNFDLNLDQMQNIDTMYLVEEKLEKILTLIRTFYIYIYITSRKNRHSKSLQFVNCIFNICVDTADLQLVNMKC